MPAYEVTTFDVCASGFERLRSYEELIVTAHISPFTESKPRRIFRAAESF